MPDEQAQARLRKFRAVLVPATGDTGAAAEPAPEKLAAARARNAEFKRFVAELGQKAAASSTGGHQRRPRNFTTTP